MGKEILGVSSNLGQSDWKNFEEQVNETGLRLPGSKYYLLKDASS